MLCTSLAWLEDEDVSASSSATCPLSCNSLSLCGLVGGDFLFVSPLLLLSLCVVPLPVDSDSVLGPLLLVSGSGEESDFLFLDSGGLGASPESTKLISSYVLSCRTSEQQLCKEKT